MEGNKTSSVKIDKIQLPEIKAKPVKDYIQLKYNKTMEMPEYDSSDAYKKKYLEGAIKDPVVELLIIPTIEDVRFEGDFDYAVMAQSPSKMGQNTALKEEFYSD